MNRVSHIKPDTAVTATTTTGRKQVVQEEKCTTSDIIQYLGSKQTSPKKPVLRTLSRLAPEVYKSIFGEIKVPPKKTTNEQKDLNLFMFSLIEFGEFNSLSDSKRNAILNLLLEKEKYEHAVIFAHFMGITIGKKNKLPKIFEVIMGKNSLSHIDENGKLDAKKSEENVNAFASNAFSNYIKGLNEALKHDNTFKYTFSYGELWLFSLNYARRVNKQFYEQKHKEAIDWCIENEGSIPNLLISRVDNPELFKLHAKNIRRT